MKPLYWIASSKKDLKSFPERVQDVMGRSLLDVQFGDTPDHTYPLRGFGGAESWRSSRTTTATRIAACIP